MSRDPLADAARRHAHAIAGHILLAAVPCGIPASLLTLDTLVEAREELSAALKYSLRALHDGVDTLRDLRLVLGLSEGDVANVVASLLQAEYIDYRPGVGGHERVLSLLPAGLDAARDAQIRQPKPSTITVVYDRLTGHVTSWTRRSLTKARDARADDERVLLMPGTTHPIEAEDLSPAALARTFPSATADAVRVLGVNGVTENRNYFRDAVLLVYKDLDSDNLQLGVDLDGAWSEEHGAALARLNAVTKLGISTAPPDPASDDVASNDDSRDDTKSPHDAARPGSVRERLPMHEVLALQSRRGDNGGDPPDDVLQRSAIRWLGVYEHPTWLEDALSNSRTRLLLSSPWISCAVVTPEWITRLESLARRADVTIFWGFGDNTDSDATTIENLHRAARRSSRLAVVRGQNTHTKLLISDEYYIKTTFNWLSFRGSRERTFRQEEGDLVRDRQLSDLAYAKYMTENIAHAEEIVGTLPRRFLDGSADNAASNPATSPSRRVRRRRTTAGSQQKSRKRGDAVSRFQVGQIVSGQVKHITNYGAFVSLDGVDGLIHISELTGGRIGHPSEVVSVGETVTVVVISLDLVRQRLSLSLRAAPGT